MELLDITDETGTADLGTATRSEAHRKGLWHRCFHLWVVDDAGVLLQRRAARKTWPRHLDATAAGHLTAGERILDGLREAKEELGVAYSADEVTALGVFRIEDTPTPGRINREHQHVFAVRDTRPLDAWTELQLAELDGLVHVSHDGFGALIAGADDVPGCEWDVRERTLSDVSVGVAELVPSPYLKQIAPTLRALGSVASR